MNEEFEYQQALNSGNPAAIARAGLALGRSREAGGELNAAADAYRVAMESGGSALAALNYGKIARILGDLESAEAAVDRALASPAKDIALPAALYKGRFRASHGEYATAEQWFLSVANANDPKWSPSALYQMGAMWWEGGDLQLAERWLVKAAESGDESAASWARVMLGQTRVEQDRLDEAQELLQPALNSGNETLRMDAYGAWGNLHQRRGNLAVAESAFKYVMTSTSPDVSLGGTLGLASVRALQGNLNEAEQLYGEAMKNGTGVRAQLAVLGLAYIHSARGELDRAEELCERVAASAWGRTLSEAQGTLARIRELRDTSAVGILHHKQDIDGQQKSAPPENAKLMEAEVFDLVSPTESPTTKSVEVALSDLEHLIGLGEVKKQVRTIANVLRMQVRRREHGLPVASLSWHMVFLGPPGTGKTTVARILGRIFAGLGLLPEGQLVEVDRARLVAEYVGQTAATTDAVLKSALGGILFIDEAYTLSSGGQNDFGSEAIATLLKRMEDWRDEMVVIAAGYEVQMEDFLRSNPGLASRFPRRIFFPNYSPTELMAILKSQVRQAGYELDPASEGPLEECIQTEWNHRDDSFGNARFVRNVVDRLVEAHANRLANARDLDASDLSTFFPDDVHQAIELRSGH